MNHEHLLGRLREEAGPKVTEDPAEEDEEEEEEANGEEEKEDTNTPSQLTEVGQRAGRGGGERCSRAGHATTRLPRQRDTRISNKKVNKYVYIL